jgi:membrane associated rhomboid family serine protease
MWNYWKRSDALTRLLLVNTAVFVALLVLHILERWTLVPISQTLGEDAHLSATAHLPELIRRPWSIVTHMFTHVAFDHFLFNMVSLYMAGRLFQVFLSPSQLVVNYLLGGLAGFGLYVLSYNVFPSLNERSFILGASAAVMSVILTVGVVQPDFEVKLFGVFDMKLKWLCALLVLIDLVTLRKGENTGGHIGHLGGALFGILYAVQLQKGKTPGRWLERWLDKVRSWPQRKAMRVEVNRGRPKTDDEFNTERKVRQDRVDRILDKISRTGYESLTKEEKDFLFKNSQQ